MHAREQAARHPLHFGRRRRGSDPGSRSPRLCSAISANSTRPRSSPVARATSSPVVMPVSSRCPRTAVVVAPSSPSSETPRVVEHLGRAPQLQAGAADEATAAAVDELHPQVGPLGPGRHGDERAQEIVEVVARLGSGRDLRVYGADRVGVEPPDRLQLDDNPRRRCTALVRRFWNSSSSRKVYGFDVRISCASTDGSVVSTVCTRTSAGLDAFEQGAQPVDVERLVQRVADRLTDDARGRGSRPGRRGCPGTRRPAGTPPP